MKTQWTRGARAPINVLMSTLLAVALLTVTTGTAAGATAPASAAGAATAARATATSPCPFTGSLCLWDNTRFRGTRFAVAALDPTVGSCVDLAAHRWPNGRARSGHNAGTQTARLYTTIDCTGEYYELLPGSTYRSIRFNSNSVFVY